MEQWIIDLMNATSWKMIPLRAYGVFHITFVLLGILLCYFFARKFQYADDKTNRFILSGLGIFLAATELYKQLFYYYHVNGGSYAWHAFPFQLCSVPMYLCIIAPILKPGKLQNAMYSCMMTYNFLGGIMTCIEPSGMHTGYWILTLHSYVWHLSLIFLGLYLALSGRGGCQMEDYRSATKCFLSLCVVAFCINVVFRDISNNSINMFFIGPQNSSLIVFKQISECFGWYVSTLLYIPTVCLGAYLVFFLIRWIGSR